MNNLYTFLIKNFDSIFILSGIIWLALTILFFWLLFKIKSLLEQLVHPSKKINFNPSEVIEDEPQDWHCPECQTINRSNSYKCRNCDYSLK